MQFISDLTFLQKLNLKPNHEFGVSAINVCEDIWELIKGAGSYSPDMLKSNYRSLRSLVSSLDSSSFLIPEHLFASPLACSRSISLFFCVPWLPCGLSVKDVFVCLLWQFFPPHTQRKKWKIRACKASQMPASSTASDRQMHLCVCVCVFTGARRFGQIFM